MTDWQDISTAPRFTRILTFFPDAVHPVMIAEAIDYEDDPDNPEWWAFDEGGTANANPTHWMPLPSPPEAKG
jgi:hypothetical protein